MPELDYLIVGQGIAGTAMAETLIKRDLKIHVIDDWNFSSSSKVSAGLFNPMVFKRLNRSWMIDELLPVAETFYSEMERKLNARFYYKKELVKIIFEENERDFWLKKALDPVLKPYLSENITTPFLPDEINSPFGVGFVFKSGNVDVKKMLLLYRDYLKSSNRLSDERFDYARLRVGSESVEYKGLRAKKIIFCQGFRASENPWFSWMKFKLSKGEILTIRCKLSLKDQFLVKGVFVVPFGEGTYKVGSTHNWEDLTENTTEKGKAELCEKLTKILKVPYTVIDQQAGVRPTVADRRPILGAHPENVVLTVFNGLGTKGTLLAPWFATHMADFLSTGRGLLKEVDIGRFV